MRKVNFILGIHNHQPVGNFNEVFEKAYKESYWPFMEIMLKHPKIKWSLHCTGILWDFLFAKHQEYIDAVKKMVLSGQLELLSGGYYEPIMPIIPDCDKKGQINKLTDFLAEKFNYKAKGMWLAERVWEPHLAKTLAGCGIDFTIVDDAHFAAAGLDVEKLRGYYVTEEQGVKLNIFPISQKMRYYIPFQTVDKTLEYMYSCSSEGGNNAIVMADDGEKFGLWPETFKHVYQDKWLDNFLSAIERNLDWIEPATFSSYAEKFPPEGRVYLPAASYFEMSEWSLPSSSQEEFESVVKHFEHNNNVKRFLRGGFWRNFLTKYPESNNMHKKMLYVSSKLQKAKEDKNDNIKALDALYSGQCNCAYWHGVFGGLYLPHLRNAVYHKLLEAENICSAKNSEKAQIVKTDFDCDGREEILYEAKTQNLYFSPHNGGSLFEWDMMDKKLNLLNVLTRRQESYHKKLREFLHNPHQSEGVKTIHDLVKVKEKNLDNFLIYDWHRRSSLLDHFIHPDTNFENFRRSQYGELGDFVLGEYEAHAAAGKITFKRQGRLWEKDKSSRIEIKKVITPLLNGFKVVYTIKNLENYKNIVVFAPEFNYAFAYPVKDESSDLKNIKKWHRKDECFGFAVDMEFSKPVDFWTFPLETVSLSEGGFERTYQGTTALPVNKIILGNNEMSEFEITVKIDDLSGSKNNA